VVDQIWERYGANPALLDEYVYEYDRAGNRTRKYNALNSDLNETYEYNALDELTSTVRNNGFDQSWTLDGLGNFSEFNDNGSSQTRDVNAANEIIDSTGIATPTYDLAGNMTSDGTLDYRYDAWNRQTLCRINSMWGVTYLYDGLGRRIMKVATESMTKQHYYYNNNWQLLESRVVENMGNETASVDQYVWSQRYIDSPIVRFHEYWNPQYNNTLYYTTDANHNVTGLVDTSGAVVERYVYDPYGKAEIRDADWELLPGEEGNGVDGGYSAYGNEILYCGYFYDAETSQNASVTVGTSGNYYVRHRYLSTQLGTFISRDPLGIKAKEMNLYRYCRNDPLDKTDPSGLDYGYATGPKIVPSAPGTVCMMVWIHYVDEGWFSNSDTVVRTKMVCSPPNQGCKYALLLNDLAQGWVDQINQQIIAGNLENAGQVLVSSEIACIMTLTGHMICNPPPGGDWFPPPDGGPGDCPCPPSPPAQQLPNNIPTHPIGNAL
jgi:RHS repeat-associated protein